MTAQESSAPARGGLDETVARFLRAAEAEGFPVGARLGSAEATAYLRRQRARATPPRESAPVREVVDLVADGKVPVRVYIPDDDATDRPLVVYFHGGGWVMGDLDKQEATCRTIAAHSGSVVVNVGYRLAPEHPYPAPLEDCLAATAWAIARAESWGASPSRTIVGGPSAGGNLAAAVAVARRDTGASPLAGQILLWPVLDARMRTRSYADKARGYLLTAPEMAFFWDAYVQGDTDRSHPWISPGLVADVAGLPRTLLITAEHDPLRDEGNDFAARLADSSLLVGHQEVAGQIHGFLTVFPESAAAQITMDAIVEAIAKMARR